MPKQIDYGLSHPSDNAETFHISQRANIRVQEVYPLSRYREADNLTFICKDPKSLCIGLQQKASTTLDVRIYWENALTSLIEDPDACSLNNDPQRIDSPLQDQYIPTLLRSDVRLKQQYVDEACFGLLKFQKTQSPSCLTNHLTTFHFFKALTGPSFILVMLYPRKFSHSCSRENDQKRHCVKLNFKR
ncbi:MAG: hypothetical protein EZS28_027209 [Streblomastix strix]|uniref:Uncharacterized protein n=2 Tax=Streblomastix strix TaxID=222440 RepID=A0A5J4V592_9EUKA|nr:MAG: hypothetical protein EZS28_027209 [Streblomastix strix]